MKLNKFTSQMLRRTFVRQLTEDDCGQACVAMLLRYAGEIEKAGFFLSTIQQSCQSLRSLRIAMTSQGYTAQCVTMTMEYLLQAEQPCILHTEDSNGNEHYQVYYGAKTSRGRTRLLMADPANQFYFITKQDLDKIWKSKAALYVENLSPNLFFSAGLHCQQRSPQRSSPNLYGSSCRC